MLEFSVGVFAVDLIPSKINIVYLSNMVSD